MSYFNCDNTGLCLLPYFCYCCYSCLIFIIGGASGCRSSSNSDSSSNNNSGSSDSSSSSSSNGIESGSLDLICSTSWSVTYIKKIQVLQKIKGYKKLKTLFLFQISIQSFCPKWIIIKSFLFILNRKFYYNGIILKDWFFTLLWLFNSICWVFSFPHL